MHIVIAGGTGFIGQALAQHFEDKKYTYTIIGRSLEKIKKIFGTNVQAIQWENEAELIAAIKKSALIINLAGENIGEKRWSNHRKEEILISRITPTRIIAELCASLKKNSPPLFNASATGVYGLQPALPQGLPPALDENTHLDFDRAPDFLSEVGRQWEKATDFAKEADVRVVNMRFAPVLGKNGGVLEKLKMPFLFGAGGKMGSGKQPFSWIALTDLIRAIDFLIEHKGISGPINFVSPECVTQYEFAKSFAKVLHRQALTTTPAWLLKLIFGQMAEELLLNGQHVIPTVLHKSGFHFQYAHLENALQAIYQ